MGKYKDDQTGVNNKVPEHKVTRRSRTSTNEEAAYHDAEEGARSQSGKATEETTKKMSPSMKKKKMTIMMWNVSWMMQTMLWKEMTIMREMML